MPATLEKKSHVALLRPVKSMILKTIKEHNKRLFIRYFRTKLIIFCHTISATTAIADSVDVNKLNTASDQRLKLLLINDSFVIVITSVVFEQRDNY